MSSLRGIGRLLRGPREAPPPETPPPEEPTIPALSDDRTGPPLPLERPVHELWRRRLTAVLHESYAGAPLYKLAEDLRVYEYLLWAARIDSVIELGGGAGGSALWFHDRLRSFQSHGRCAGALVISVDTDISLARANIGDRRGIRLMEGDITDPALPARVEAELPPGARCLVVEDGPHTYDATYAALEGFSRFVPVGGWYVAEDGVVDEDELRVMDSWPRGVRPAVADWLGTPAGSAFTLRRDMEAYGITTNCGGYLQRTG